jgi:DNA mismatch repair protein MutS
MSAKEETPSIYRDYFRITEEYVEKYGKNTFLLMQVGAFFEMYGLKSTENNSNRHSRSEIDAFSQICSLSVSDKKIMFEGGSIVMAGFRDYTLDKYIPKITEAGYTAVVFVQEQETSGKCAFRRVLDTVYSPGTCISYDTETSAQITNNIMCIWMDVHIPVLQRRSGPVGEKIRETLIYGVAVANIFTGKTSIFEHQTPLYMAPTTFDELERYVSVYSPSEVIIVSPFERSYLDRIIQFSGVQTNSIHCVDTRNIQNEKVQNCMKQKYIQHMFSTFYTEETYSLCSEFNTYSIATQAFCFLLNFIQEHNPNLVRNIDIPVINNTSSRMVLANHTLKQLNIIDNDESKSAGVFSSVSTFLNKCSTPIGRRQFYTQLTNPVFDEAWICREYSMIQNVITPENYAMVDPFRKSLREICDIEKLMRQLMVRKIYPNSWYKLWSSIRTVQQLNACLFENTEIVNYLCSGFVEEGQGTAYAYIEQMTRKVCHMIERFLLVETCQGINGFEHNFICSGVSPLLDETLRKQAENMELFHKIRETLNAVVRSSEKNADLDYIKVHETEKSGLSLQITKKRGTILKKYFSENPTKPVLLSNSTKTYLGKEVQFVSASSSNDDIEIPLLSNVCRELLQTKQRLSEIIEKVYFDFLKEFETECYRALEQLSSYVAKLDILITKTYLAKTYNYCCPEIVSENSEHRNTTTSFVEATGLRHCLIEHIQQNEIYVSNDLTLGKTDMGMLLYGTNAVGKTSLIRALGIAIIMAQSGMFVPCSRFVYKPYTAIFSRILGNDNLFKGLSTFAVEMSELRMILKMTDERSLVLGDELCSGTETESALSIFMAGLCDLSTKNASFLFATHFHEILKMDEISELENVTTKHMAVHYDRELDCLVYDRKLMDGPGNRMYGLEVCKSLHLPSEFLEKAYTIRGKYFPETKGELSSPPSKSYNANKIRGKCEMCHLEIGEETHHLQEQRGANSAGFIGEFHKNHVANLMSLCSKCHDLVHCEQEIVPKNKTNNLSETGVCKEVKKVVRKKTTKGYSIFVESEWKKEC